MHIHSNWTRGDLGHDIDRNPSVACDHCGEEYGLMSYWPDRHPELPGVVFDSIGLICDDCIEAAHEEYALARRRRKHTQLTEWCE